MYPVKISVVIPVYNVEKYLQQCLDSIVNQTLEEIEIICVNDCSTDNSSKILEEYSAKDERIRIISKEKNEGPGPARNRGMEDLNGDYVSFIDSDDFIIQNTAYEKLYEFALKNHADMVSGNIKLYRYDEIEIPD